MLHPSVDIQPSLRAVGEVPPEHSHSDAPAASATPQPSGSVWLRAFFALARHAPWTLRVIRPLAIYFAVIVSAEIRENTRANARRIFRRPLGVTEQRRFARAVVGNFFDFVADLSRWGSRDTAGLAGRLDSVEGLESYRACRAMKRGCILVTAHMGSFEVGLAALATEEKNIHVVFKRDASDAFEVIRSQLRRSIGAKEAPIDDGWEAWLRLRDALLNDEAVVIQADRAVPGQKSRIVNFLGGRLRLPLGPARLAQLTGSPIVPVLTLRAGRDRFRVRMMAPIEIQSGIEASAAVDLAFNSVARALESAIAEFPEQWLVLHRAFEEEPADGI